VSDCHNPSGRNSNLDGGPLELPLQILEPIFHLGDIVLASDHEVSGLHIKEGRAVYDERKEERRGRLTGDWGIWVIKAKPASGLNSREKKA
jgi:hypothetical protein